jgi:hypothetical protein
MPTPLKTEYADRAALSSALSQKNIIAFEY